MIKLVTAGDAAKPIGVVVNSARDAEEGGLVFRQISLAADRFLGRTLRYDGHVLEDRLVKDSSLAQIPLVGSDWRGPATDCIRRLAMRLTSTRSSGSGPWPSGRPPGPPSGAPPVEASPCA